MWECLSFFRFMDYEWGKKSHFGECIDFFLYICIHRREWLSFSRIKVCEETKPYTMKTTVISSIWRVIDREGGEKKNHFCYIFIHMWEWQSFWRVVNWEREKSVVYVASNCQYEHLHLCIYIEIPPPFTIYLYIRMWGACHSMYIHMRVFKNHFLLYVYTTHT